MHIKSPTSSEIIENDKAGLNTMEHGRHNYVDIKIGITTKNHIGDRFWLEKESFLEYSINAFYTPQMLCAFSEPIPMLTEGSIW